MIGKAMWDVQATAASGIDATQTEPQAAQDHVDVVEVPGPHRPGGAQLWLLVDEVGGDDKDVVGAHVGLCGAGTGVDAGQLAPVVVDDRGGAVAVRRRRRRRGVAAPEGAAVAACVAETGELVLQDEAGDEAGEAVEAEAADVVAVDATALRGEEVVVPAKGLGAPGSQK